MITESTKQSLEHGMFSTKYKVFCRGIQTFAQLKEHSPDFAEDFRNENGFFLVVDNDDKTELKLTDYLNTNIQSRSPGLIFEKIFAVKPESAQPYEDIIPHYFTISSSGKIEELHESQVNAFLNV